MEFMLLFLNRADEPCGEPAGFAAMKKFSSDLASERKLRRGAPLSADGARVRVRDGEALVTDGPFAESREIVGGFWIIDAPGREQAIEIARRTPHARGGTVEVHPVGGRYTFTDSAKGTPFLLAFRMEPGLSDPDGSKMREMIAFGEELEREAKLFETAPLAQEPLPARIETRSGKTMVTDGPFAEAREAVGGYSLLRVADRAEAIEIAKRYPHAKWGPVEVREIMFFDPT